jgi:hypothetical protein
MSNQILAFQDNVLPSPSTFKMSISTPEDRYITMPCNAEIQWTIDATSYPRRTES